MVDDILTIQKCSTKAAEVNAVINSFVELKKLRLSKEKCHRVHVSKQSKKETNCPKLKVHEEEMETSEKEKYLGDVFNKNGSPKVNIEERKHKGYAIVSEILAILNEVPLGSHRMEIGLLLRQAMLINGILFNSESWHAVTDEDLKGLEKVDEHLLRSIVNGHSKTPSFCILKLELYQYGSSYHAEE